MKNQYFGNANDFMKYGILRLFTKNGEFRTGICWMLTPNDQSSHGKNTNYLTKANQWKAYDPTLFEFLYRTVHEENRREVNVLESETIISNSKYYSVLLKDSVADRAVYFDEMVKYFDDVEIVFFDPDNGLEVSSVPSGRLKSSKYLYYAELADLFQRGYSLLIYQHFPRIEHSQFIKKTSEKIRQHIGSVEIHALSTSNVVYFLVTQPNHAARFHQPLEQIRVGWINKIGVSPL